MKKNTQKKLQLVKIKIASLNPVSPVSGKGQVNDAISNSSCNHICPTICSLECVVV
ncbi:hypothetical protein SAMN05518672_10242 [Chitinophaga sp. CF118]|uniref:hypothetical protein n=1 Tax=Chitinophaga sp. CF118 TaxID=1884367 RepID=UPI0008E165FB|nr:hypothetical protein [Chitinophaga sp. CF118]SFD46161.1 hypothetical protein SAMN05518672_10242 [Chitinophaga sp. CF118]